jgi:hypothetical protein
MVRFSALSEITFSNCLYGGWGRHGMVMNLIAQLSGVIILFIVFLL